MKLKHLSIYILKSDTTMHCPFIIVKDDKGRFYFTNFMRNDVPMEQLLPNTVEEKDIVELCNINDIMERCHNGK